VGKAGTQALGLHMGSVRPIPSIDLDHARCAHPPGVGEAGARPMNAGISSAEKFTGQVGVLGRGPVGGPLFGQAPRLRFQLSKTFPVVPQGPSHP